VRRFNRQAPKFEDLSSSEVLCTGIKVIDLLSLTKGKISCLEVQVLVNGIDSRID
jgi:F0F1-type ATP synthase beta subunit